jgi:hypothetical protein
MATFYRHFFGHFKILLLLTAIFFLILKYFYFYRAKFLRFADPCLWSGVGKFQKFGAVESSGISESKK